MSPYALRAHSLLLTDQDRLDIARGAATLYECLGEPGASRITSVREGRDLLDAWAEAFSPGDHRAFQRRLSWDGLDEDAVLRALLEPMPSSGRRPPPWTAWLDRFLEEGAAFAAQLGSPEADAEIARLAPCPEPPFLEVWISVVRAARAAVGGRSLDGIRPAACAALERSLLSDLSAAGELVLYESFRAYKDATGKAAGPRYPAFVRSLLAEGGLAAVFKAYPVLGRHLATMVSTWVASTVELVDRLRRDRDAMATAFGDAALGEVCAAEPALSDRHDGGRRVSVLTFTSGRRVVYKPREVGLERAFQEFQAWVSSRGLACAPRTFRVVEREGHGWAEFVDQEPLEDRRQVAEYFRRAGAALCILHVLRGADAHQENVVATRGGPVLVDSEMLLQPVDRDEERDATTDGSIDGAAHGVPRSCLSPGFVTLLDLDADGVAYDVGGLMPASPRTAFGGERSWRALRSDDLHFVRERTIHPALRNDVVLDGVVQRPEGFAAEILCGFAEAYRFFVTERPRLLDPEGPLSLFAGRRSRLLFRPTEQYGFFLHATAAPRYQRSGLDRSVALEMLNRVFRHEEKRPQLWPLVADERRALEDLDVPRYLLPADESVLTAASGESVRGYLVRSGLDAVAAGLRDMSDEDLEQQLEILESALEAGAPPIVVAARGPGAEAAGREGFDPKATWIRGAVMLGDRIVDRARRADDGTLSWGRGGGAPGGADLYRGQAGIALFLAALAAVTGDERFSEAASSSLRPLARALDAPTRASWPSIGACAGLGSVVYALASAGGLLGDARWTELARRWAMEISPARIESDVHFDVAGGAAGALLALLAVDEPGGPTWVRDRVRDCARRLVAAQEDTGAGGGAWAGRDGRPRAGFAHGAAGIAYALSRAYVATGVAELEEPVRRAHRFERRLFSHAARNWPAAHEGGTAVMTAWCHGAPGIGIARALGLEAFRDDAILEEIHVALETTSGAPSARTDHICCGDMGRSEALLTMGTCLQDTRPVAAAEAMATRFAERVCAGGTRAIRTEGFEHRTFDPGFFRGLAGIGYQLLRTAAPARIPSVLGFQSGPAAR